MLAEHSKNLEPRRFKMTVAMRRLLEARKPEHDRIKRQGCITPLVFWRVVADEGGGEKKPHPIKAFTKAWNNGRRAAGLSGNFVTTFADQHVGTTFELESASRLR